MIFQVFSVILVFHLFFLEVFVAFLGVFKSVKIFFKMVCNQSGVGLKVFLPMISVESPSIDPVMLTIIIP